MRPFKQPSQNWSNHADVPDGNTLQDPKLIAEVEQLRLIARKTASSAVVGMHASTRHGTAIEFSEHKLYAPGDDIRQMDWRAYAKTDRFHIKRYEDETRIEVFVLVDVSGSMGFVEKGLCSKLAYAKILTAAMSYLALHQRDAVGLCAFSETMTFELQAKAVSTHWEEMLVRLAALQAKGKTNLANALTAFVGIPKKPALVLVLSDLFESSQVLMEAMQLLLSRKHDVMVLHTLDPAEIDFSYEHPSQFEDLEVARHLFVHPRALKKSYVREFGQFLARTKQNMEASAIPYFLVTTDTPQAEALRKILANRTRKVRQ